MKISIIGSGFVGKSTGLGLSDLGHDVMFYDIHQGQLNELSTYKTTTDLKKALTYSKTCFICVPTPTMDNKQDLTILNEVVKDIRYYIKDALFIVKSTILPGTMENLFYENERAIYNPEFITQNNKAKTFKRSDFIIIGYNKNIKDVSVLGYLYRKLDIPIYLLSYRNAEALKYLYNYFLATKISFWNDVYKKLKLFDIDVKQIAPIISLDNRIGLYGSRVGQAYGGACLSKDIKAFLTWLKENNIELNILKEVDKINEKA